MCRCGIMIWFTDLVIYRVEKNLMPLAWAFPCANLTYIIQRTYLCQPRRECSQFIITICIPLQCVLFTIMFMFTFSVNFVFAALHMRQMLETTFLQLPVTGWISGPFK